MATSNPNRFAEPTIIGTESEARQYAERKDNSQPTAKKGKTTFDTDAFLQREEEKMRAAEEMERKINARISEYSIPWNFMDKLPPLPGMKLNAGLVRWEPEDLDAFVSEYGEEVKKLAAERKEEQETARKAYFANATKRRKSRGTSDSKSSKPDSDQVTIMTEMGNPSQQNVTASEDTPTVKTASTSNPTQAESLLHQKGTTLTAPDTTIVETVNDIGVPTGVITATDTTIMTTTDKAEAQPNVADAPAVTGKATRISAKMRRASRQEFHDTYLVKTDTKGGKPITISANLIKRLYRICARSGDYRACPTYLVNNLLMEILNIIEPDTEGWADLD